MLGAKAPQLAVRWQDQVVEPLEIARDWNGDAFRPDSVNWDAAAQIELGSENTIVVEVRSDVAPSTARLKLFKDVDPETGIPADAAVVDLECPEPNSSCELEQTSDGYRVAFHVPQSADIDGTFATVSFRWKWIPQFEDGETTSAVDNVWSVASGLRLRK